MSQFSLKRKAKVLKHKPVTTVLRISSSNDTLPRFHLMPLFRCENIIRAALDVAVKDFLERVINSGIAAFPSLYPRSFPII